MTHRPFIRAALREGRVIYESKLKIVTKPNAGNRLPQKTCARPRRCKMGWNVRPCMLSRQQCAEKAVSALWYLLGEDPVGTFRPKAGDASSRTKVAFQTQRIGNRYAAALDKFYIPTQYPNGLL